MAEVVDARGLRRLQLALGLTWSVAWAAGLVFFATVVVRQEGETRKQNLDAELALRAVATYGLAWFDADGTFHPEALVAEPWVTAEGVDIWIVEPTVPPVRHLSPAEVRFEVGDLDALAAEVVGDLEPRYVDRGGFRVHAIPTFLEGTDDEAHAAIVAVGDPQATAGGQSFAREVVVLAAILGILGIGVGVFLARWSIRPLAATFAQRERFLVASAHELRSPVASMLAVCESGIAGDEPPAEALERAGALARRTAEVVEGLLLFARLEAGSADLERQAVRLDLLVESAAPEDASLAVVDDDDCIARVDPRLVRVAVENLVRNARVHGRAADSALELLVSATSVTVEDAGPGYPAAILELVGGPLSIAPSSSGAGVGLATVRMIAELHGGGLLLENRSSGGARAVLNLGPRETK